jgi:arsenite methyltransferase
MAVDVDIDVEVLKCEIKKTYAEVSQEPEKDFIFPTGRAWALDLGYPADLLANVPDASAESFAGVANPFSLGPLACGERVLDVGCGAGTDSLVAAQMVAPDGHVRGIDMTPEMLAKARASASEMGVANVEFVGGEAEDLPFADATFDVVISNGVIDLVPDKDAVYAEIYRVLAPGGRIQVADVTIQTPVSEEGRRKIASGPVESQALCWRQNTAGSSSATGSSGSRPATSSRPTHARRFRTRAAKPRSTAPAAPR